MFQAQATNDGTLWLLRGTTGTSRASRTIIQDEVRTALDKVRKFVTPALLKRAIIALAAQRAGA